MIPRVGQTWRFGGAGEVYVVLRSERTPAGTHHHCLNMLSGQVVVVTEFSSEGPWEWRPYLSRLS